MEPLDVLLDAPTAALIRQAKEQRLREYKDLIGRLQALGVTVRLAGVARPVMIDGILLDRCPFHLRGTGAMVELFIWRPGDHPGQDMIDATTGEEYRALDLDGATWHYELDHDDADHIRAGELQSAFSHLLAEHRAAGDTT